MGFIQTASGKHYDYLNTFADDVVIDDEAIVLTLTLQLWM